MKRIKNAFILILLLLFSSQLYSAGFFVNVEQGMKAMSLGGAFVGLADDPTAIYFNPAGITQLEGRFNFAATYAFGKYDPELHRGRIIDKYGITRIGPDNKEIDQRWAQIPSGYITAKVNKYIYLGFAVFAPYGTATDWTHTWFGRYFADKTDLKTFDFNPTLSIKFNDKFSIGIGVNYVYGDVEIKKSFSYPFLAFNPQVQAMLGFSLNNAQQLSLYNRLYDRNYDVDMRLEGDTSDSSKGWGFNVGILFKPNEHWQFGAVYRSEIDLHFEGHAHYKYMPGVATLGQEVGIPQLSAYPLFKKTKIKAKLTLPDWAAIGIVNKSFKKWTFLFDAYWTGWSDYDALTVKFKDFPYESSVPKDWDDVWGFRFGAQYQATPNVALRFGFWHDNTPVDDDTRGPELPDTTKNAVTFGVGIKKGRFNFDFAYLVGLYQDKDSKLVDEQTGTRLAGKWTLRSHVIGVTVSYKY